MEFFAFFEYVCAFDVHMKSESVQEWDCTL